MALGSPSEDEVIPENPSITRDVVSFSPESAKALKAELGLDSSDLLVGIPAGEADRLGLHHGDDVKVTSDGQNLLLGATRMRVVNHTQKGALTKVGLSRGIREAVGLQDHRETGTDKPDSVTLTVIMVGDRKAVLLKKAASGK